MHCLIFCLHTIKCARPQIIFLNQNICCGYSKEPSHWDSSFEHPKHMFKLIDKKIITILRWIYLLNWPYDALFCLFVCFVALHPKSTAMVIAGRSVHLTTLFSWASLNKQLTSNRAHIFACNWQQPFMNDSAEGSRMTVEIISWSISTKVWDRAGMELATLGSAVSFASVTRHVTDCATRPGALVQFLYPFSTWTDGFSHLVWCNKHGMVH